MVEKTELSDKDHRDLVKTCASRGLTFLTTVFHEDRVPFLSDLGLEAIKIGSGEAMRKVLVCITVRPSLARVQTVLDNLVGLCDLQVVMAASTLLERYGRVVETFAYPKNIIDHVYSTLEGETTETSAIETGVLTMQLARTFSRHKPDVVVTIADRHETLATAIAASYQHIPLCHIQGGERTGSIDDKVRDAVSMLADVHCAATGTAATRLQDMGVRGDVFHTGCPSVDLAAKIVPDPADANTIVVLQHSVTNEAEHAREQIEATIQAIEAVTPKKVLWFWPGQDAGSGGVAKGLRLYHERIGNRQPVCFTRHVSADAFLSLLSGCAALVGNSSCGIRESAYLGTPVVNIGSRQQGRECGPNVVHVGHHATDIAEAIQRQVAHGRYPSDAIYGDGHSGARIARILLGSAEPVTGPDLVCDPVQEQQQGTPAQKHPADWYEWQDRH